MSSAVPFTPKDGCRHTDIAVDVPARGSILGRGTRNVTEAHCRVFPILCTSMSIFNAAKKIRHLWEPILKKRGQTHGIPQFTELIGSLPGANKRRK